MRSYFFPKRKFLKFGLYIILFFICLTFADEFYSDSILVNVEEKAKIESMLFVETAVRENVITKLDTNDMLKIEYDNLGNITHVSLNTVNTNMILSDVSRNLYGYINDIKKNSNICDMTIPFSQLFATYLKVEFGPYIKYNIEPVGSYFCDITASAIEYGINSSLIEVDLNIEMTFKLVFPLKDLNIFVNTSIPLVIELIYGVVPDFYYGSLLT